MQLAYDILAFVQAAWPTLAVIAVVVLGLVWIGRTPGGRLKIVDLALAIVGRITTAGIAACAIDRLQDRAGDLERKLPPEVRAARRRAQSLNVRPWKP